MAHYALIDESGLVVQVIVGRDEAGFDGESYYSGNGLTAKRTSYNTFHGVHYTQNVHLAQDPEAEPGVMIATYEQVVSSDQTKAFRKNYAGIGMIYDSVRDAFMWPQPYPSWVLDENTCVWHAPVAQPEDGSEYAWSEPQTQWVAKPNDGAPYVWSAEDDAWLRAL